MPGVHIPPLTLLALRCAECVALATLATDTMPERCDARSIL